MISDYLVPDLLEPGLSLIFCGTAPSPISARAKAYYANPGNGFWPALHRCGLTPTLLQPHEYPELLRLGIGLTDLCKNQAGSDDDLPQKAFDRASVEEKIRQYQPAIVAFTSKNAGSLFLKRHKIEYGLQPELIGKTRLFVLSSSSGRARRFWREDIWKELGQLYRAERIAASKDKHLNIMK